MMQVRYGKKDLLNLQNCQDFHPGCRGRTCDGAGALRYAFRTRESDVGSGFLGGTAYCPKLFLFLCRLTSLPASCLLKRFNTNAACSAWGLRKRMCTTVRRGFSGDEDAWGKRASDGAIVGRERESELK